jgi:RNA polymerase sigma-70 factor (ECF subfamily)
LTSEVFVRLVEKIDRFTYRGRPLLAWLYTIARNLITDHHRKVKRFATYPLKERERLVAEAVDPEEAARRSLMQDRLVAAIAHLTEDQRQVIILKFIEGLDNKTTAQILSKSVGAVKSLQHRALAALRRILEQNGF